MNRMVNPLPLADTHESLSKYQSSLPVSLIATPRSEFVTCKATDYVEHVIEKTAGQEFDHLPVVSRDGGADGIIGVFTLSRFLPEQEAKVLVGDHMEMLTEKHLVGADASIESFITDADSFPFRLIVAGRNITGLVSISDLQRLPVRAALFAMVTHLEMTMSDTIRIKVRDRWQEFLRPNRRDNLKKRLEQARRENTLVEPLFYTQFCDKRDILSRVMSQDSTWPQSFERDMREVERLRNNLAHANNFAGDRDAEVQLCGTARTMIIWIKTLEEIVESIR